MHFYVSILYSTINPFHPIRSYATCLEGALKIKELTYMHSEGTQISSAEDFSKSRLCIYYFIQESWRGS